MVHDRSFVATVSTNYVEDVFSNNTSSSNVSLEITDIDDGDGPTDFRIFYFWMLRPLVHLRLEPFALLHMSCSA